MSFPASRPQSIWLLLVAISLILLRTNLISQESSFDLELFGVAEGLSQNSVNSIIQDSHGFIWFGTQDGLNKFDGHNFTVYKYEPNTPSSLSDNFIVSIYEDRNNVLWIGTSLGVLSRFDNQTGTFENYPLHRNESIFTLIEVIIEDSKSRLWIGSEGGGLSYFNRENQQFLHFRHDSANNKSISSDLVYDIFEEDSGYFWVATSRGINKFDPDNGTFVRYSHTGNNHSLTHNKVQAIIQDNAGVLWLGTEGGLCHFNPSTEAFTHIRIWGTKLINSFISCLLKDSSDNIWIGTRTGLARYNRKTETYTTYQNTENDRTLLKNGDIRSLYEDASGVLWLGTYSTGVAKLAAHKKFMNYTQIYNLQPELVENLSWSQSIYEDDSGTLWLGTYKSGLVKITANGKYKQYLSEPNQIDGISHNDVRAIGARNEEELWLATWGGGLNRLNINNDTFQQYKHNPDVSGSIVSNFIWSIYMEDPQTLWVSTIDGLDKLDITTKEFIHFNHEPENPNSLSTNEVRMVYKDKSGNLWICTIGGGLNKMVELGTHNEFIHYRHDPSDPNSLSSNDIETVLETAPGVIWVGTYGGGINRFDVDTQSFISFTEKEGLANNIVYGILDDDDGNLWLSTNRGLSKFDPTNNLFTNYDPSDGLHSYEFSSGAYYKNRSGRMFFGGLAGLDIFYPSEIRASSYQPPVIITAFKKFGQHVEMNRGISTMKELGISYKDAMFSFQFNALDYTNPKENRYAYLLKGFDQDWIYSGTSREAIYTNIEPNSYVFRVKGTNSDGVWSDKETSISITIRPPFWRTRWFYLLACISLGFLVYFIHRSRLNRLLAIERAKVEERELLRKEVSKDFHDELGFLITHIVLECRHILGGTRENDGHRAGNIKRIIDMVQSIKSSTQDLIWALDPDDDTVFNVLVKLKTTASELLNSAGIEVKSSDIPESFKNLKVPMNWKRQMSLLVKECINNVVRHSKCRSVVISFSMSSSGDTLNLTIWDDGIGFENEHVNNGQGLRNLQARAGSLGADIQITSNVEGGTSIILRCPTSSIKHLRS